MQRPSDEMLMAFADDALIEAQKSAVAAALADDPAARRLVAQFRLTADLARHAFQEVMWVEPPVRLASAIRKPRRSLPLTLRWPVPPLYLPQARTHLLLAALAIGAAGAVCGLWPQSDREAPLAIGPVAPDTELHRVLDDGVDSNGLAQPAFRDPQGRLCRQLALRPPGDAAASEVQLVACRRAGGEWLVVAAVASSVDGDAVLPPGAALNPTLKGLIGSSATSRPSEPAAAERPAR